MELGRDGWDRALVTDAWGFFPIPFGFFASLVSETSLDGGGREEEEEEEERRWYACEGDYGPRGAEGVPGRGACVRESGVPAVQVGASGACCLVLERSGCAG